MNKFKIFLLGSIVSAASSLSAQITVTFVATAGNAGDPLYESDGTTEIADGTLGLIIVDTGDDGVALSAGNLIDESFLGSSNDWLVGRISSSDIFGSSVAGTSGIEVTSSDISPEQDFYIVWLPGLVFSSDTSISAGQKYGLSRNSNWEVPNDGGSTAGIVSNSPGGSANLTVVPEPEAFAFLAGLLGLGLVFVRRRRS
ncbi:hypothetical protein [Puniceicoccus vermicola]|uniref:PEP-CTERM sorting domain-containing protein n=1 Tax=Puniceicoccus vermicola TaxID=388746 RepID=A0A7X1E6L1_9BACT|nr:hypothetical protein [Puniceicoccus vermicola]MBC2604218.1 hypothetical protein [Puniceicoccus vermicola]